MKVTYTAEYGAEILECKLSELPALLSRVQREGKRRASRIDIAGSVLRVTTLPVEKSNHRDVKE